MMEKLEKGEIRNGTFRCAYSFEKLYIAVIAAAVLASAVFLTTSFQPSTENEQGDPLKYLFAAGTFVIACFFCLTLERYAIEGAEYHYQADSVCFTIISPGGARDEFYYCDVTSVTYKEIQRFGALRGYKVTITSTYRKSTYKYVFSRNKVLNKPEDSPFFIIEVNAGLIQGLEYF